MKTTFLAASLLALCCSASAQVSITVGQPNFYGRIDIGGYGPPPVIYEEPIIVRRPARLIEEPLYLRVPPGHAKNWSKHCGRYNACGRRVLFVRDDWYLNDYAPRYREEHYGGRGPDHRDDGDHRGHGKGHGHGNGHGHGKGHGRD